MASTWLTRRQLRVAAQNCVRSSVPVQSYLNTIRARFVQRLPRAEQSLLATPPQVLSATFDPTVEQQTASGELVRQTPASEISQLQTAADHAADYVGHDHKSVLALNLLEHSQQISNARRYAQSEHQNTIATLQEVQDRERQAGLLGQMIDANESFPSHLKNLKPLWRKPFPWFYFHHIGEYVLAMFFFLIETVTLLPSFLNDQQVDISDWSAIWTDHTAALVIGILSVTTVTATFLGLALVTVFLAHRLYHQAATIRAPKTMGIAVIVLLVMMFAASYSLAVLRANISSTAAPVDTFMETSWDEGMETMSEPHSTRHLHILLFTIMTVCLPLLIALYHVTRHHRGLSPEMQHNKDEYLRWQAEYTAFRQEEHTLRIKHQLQQISLNRRNRYRQQLERQQQKLENDLQALNKKDERLAGAGMAAQAMVTQHLEEYRLVLSKIDHHLAEARGIYMEVALHAQKPHLLDADAEAKLLAPRSITDRLLHDLEPVPPSTLRPKNAPPEV